MIVSAQLLAALMTNYRTIFDKSLAEESQKNDDYKKITTLMTSTTLTESYNWLGDWPTMREWKDEREYKGIADYTYSLTNVHYESTIEVDRDTYEDDRLGLIPPRIRGLSLGAIQHMNQTVFDKLDAGATDLAYDGTAFFADTRTIGDSGNIDNLLSGAYSGSATEIRTALQLAVQTMRTYKSDTGIYLNLSPDTVVCSPKMEIPMKLALQPTVAGTVRPELSYIKTIIVRPEIDADADDWYILNTTASLRPLIFQLRKKPEFVALTAPDNTHVFKARSFLYGVDDRFAVGYGDPRTAIKIVDA